MINDDKLHFEILLKYIYTNHYNTAELRTLVAGDMEQHVLIAMGICAVADKYCVATIFERASSDIRGILLTKETGRFELLRSVIATHYKDAGADSIMGKIITSIVVDGQCKFMNTTVYELMLRNYPIFAVDMALALARDSLHIQCASRTCMANFVVHSDKLKLVGSTLIKCPICGTDISVMSKVRQTIK